ncbi:MAG: response regulator [Xanthomonadales bacterium]|nr:response regulator [Xanthomonadales bacterium]
MKACGTRARSSTITLVEDDTIQQELIELALAEAGLRVSLRCLRDGREALAALRGWVSGERDGPPDLLLLDIKLPGLTGIEILQTLREDGRPIPFPVVMLTSSRMPDDLTHSFGSGAISYFVKPDSFDELIRLMDTIGRRWLDAGS